MIEGGLIKEDEMGSACGTYMGEANRMQGFGWRS